MLFIVIMNDILFFNSLITKYSEVQKGVFTIGDLKTLFNDFNDLSLFRKINKLVENDILKKFFRGYYITPEYNIEHLSSVICEESYISLNTILAKEMIIGSIPKFRLSCVKLGRNREYKNEEVTIKYFSISDQLFFGYKKIEGINYALKEKAFLDTLYFYQKGNKFSFNIFQDINIEKLNLDLITYYLKEYKNPRFVSFVKGYLDERF